MEHCSRYWGNGEGCFGMVFVVATSECWIRNSTTSTASLTAKPDHFSALLKSTDEMKPLSETCPNSDLSINSLSGIEGIQYTTHCGKVISGFDGCFSGYPKPCLENPYQGFYHTSTLEECLRICMDQAPLCRAVSWNPGLEIGFANCWPKTGFPETLTDPSKNQGVLHSATITQIDPVDRNCPASKTYSAAGSKKDFEIHCGQLNTGTNITSLHTQNLTACMDACASSSDTGCIGVLFDSTLAGGYKNCYLQNTTSVITDQTSATYAVLSNTILPSSSSSSSPNNSSSSSSSSKAWIAGPVLGALAALAILGFAIFWWRRRRSSSSDATTPAIEKQGVGNEAYGPAPAYSPGVVGVQQQHLGGGQQGYYDVHAPASEMDGGEGTTMELPASTKYAHTSTGASGGAKVAPMELP
jgi:hypothetical protein